ncbi:MULTISPECIES: hypothetical protein [Jannaschia]|nr:MULTISPECIES: hypothetical protein [unclassified Jannaschia]
MLLLPLLAIAGPAFGDLLDVTAPITRDLPVREGTFGTDRCGGLMMLVLAGEVINEPDRHNPQINLALMGFIESGMRRTTRTQAEVMAKMKDYAVAYSKQPIGKPESYEVMMDDARYCRALARSIGKLP